MKEARGYARDKMKQSDSIPSNKLKKDIENDEKLEMSIITTFNFIEGMYISIDYNRVNKELLMKSFAIVYCAMHETFQCWIDSQDVVFKEHIHKFYNLCNEWKTQRDP